MSNIFHQKLTTRRVIQYALPSIVMQVFLSLYSIVDGVFVSRLVGSNALAAINISYPAISLMVALSIMFATGGSAIVAKLLGEKQEQEARRIFTFIILVSLVVGSLLSILVFVALTPLYRPSCYRSSFKSFLSQQAVLI